MVFDVYEEGASSNNVCGGEFDVVLVVGIQGQLQMEKY